MSHNLNGTPHLVARRDFDLIPRRSEVIVAPAQLGDFDFLATMAKAKIPDVSVTGTYLRAVAQRDPDTILSFRFKGALVGGVAFLFLNKLGIEALLSDTIDFSYPPPDVLAGPTDDVAGIYTWATALDSRGILGLGNVAEHLSKRRFRFADLYGRPNTEDGRRLVQSVGFRPMVSTQENLWIYQRAWKRAPYAAIAGTNNGHAHV